MDIDTRNSLLYVVELAVGKEYSDAYLRFLEEFVERVLEIDGFQRAQIFTQLPYLQDAAAGEKIHISVHYTIANEQALHNFMEHHRVKVAQAGSEFHYEVVSRKVYKPDITKYPQTGGSGIMFHSQ